MGVKELEAQLEKAKAGLLELTNRVDGEGRDWSQAERDEAGRRLGELRDLKGQVDTAKAEDRLRGEIDDAIKGLDLTGPSAEHAAKNGGGGAARLRSLGDQFWEDPAYQQWLKAHAGPEGHIPDSTKGLASPPVFFRGFKDVVTGVSDTSAGALVVPQQAPLVELPARPLTVRGVITTGRTGSDTVEYARITALTSAAAPVAEATGTAGSGAKPESAMTFERVSTPVRTIAHWLPATKRALADAGQLRTLIDGFLRQGLEEEVEDQIVTGDGTGENFAGIGNTAGVQAQAWDTDLLTTTRRARTLVRTVGRANPTAYLLNPADWERLDLLSDNENRYYFGGPQVLGTPRLWGLPVVESEAVPAGTGYVGDFRVCVLWDREQASIQVSDSHSDFFTRNLVAILAEMRAAFGILRPAALVEMDLTAV